jgi:hypothetical protein
MLDPFAVGGSNDKFQATPQKASVIPRLISSTTKLPSGVTAAALADMQTKGLKAYATEIKMNATDP